MLADQLAAGVVALGHVRGRLPDERRLKALAPVIKERFAAPAAAPAETTAETT